MGDPPGRATSAGRPVNALRPGPYLVRVATEQDGPAIREVRRQTWHAAYDAIWGAEAIERYFAGELELHSTEAVAWRADPVRLVAERDGEIVGVAVSGVREDGDGQLGVFNVLPEHQGWGIGLQLWHATLARLRERGCAAMQVWMFARNTPARRFYERRGCRQLWEGAVLFGDWREAEVGHRVEL